MGAIEKVTLVFNCLAFKNPDVEVSYRNTQKFSKQPVTLTKEKKDIEIFTVMT